MAYLYIACIVFLFYVGDASRPAVLRLFELALPLLRRRFLPDGRLTARILGTYFFANPNVVGVLLIMGGIIVGSQG